MSSRALAFVASLLLILSVARGGDIEATYRAIRAEGLRTLGTYRLLERLVKIAPHRLSGSPGAALAVKWARATMGASGLANVRLEPVKVPHWVRGDVEELTLLGAAGAAGTRLPILALGGSVATPEEGVTAEVLEVRSFEELTEKAEAAKGKIVLFDRPMDPTRIATFLAYGEAVEQRVHGASKAAAVGAVAAIVRSMTLRLDDVPHTGVMHYADDAPKIPTAAVSTRGAERISALLAAGGPVRLRLRLSCRTLPDADSANVVGELVGREKPEEIVLIGAHLDGWDVGQGAHDDGAGCAQVIEAARLLGRLGLRPRRTIRVVLFMNEENGLRGGRAYAREHEGELSNHVLAIESDAGGFTPRAFSTNAGEAAFATLETLVEPLTALGASRLLKGGGGADISPMGPAGVVLAGYLPDTQRYFDFHHAVTDRIEAVNERELEMGTISIASLAWAVADAPDRLPPNPPAQREGK